MNELEKYTVVTLLLGTLPGLAAYNRLCKGSTSTDVLVVVSEVYKEVDNPQ
jgi:hypothetical protein